MLDEETPKLEVSCAIESIPSMMRKSERSHRLGCASCDTRYPSVTSRCKGRVVEVGQTETLPNASSMQYLLLPSLHGTPALCVEYQAEDSSMMDGFGTAFVGILHLQSFGRTKTPLGQRQPHRLLKHREVSACSRYLQLSGRQPGEELGGFTARLSTYRAGPEEDS
jgi:hypothetical protein